MSAAAERPLIPHSHVEQLRAGKNILLQEADALTQLSQQLDADFCAALQLLEHCTGSVIVTGMGKAGLIGKKNCGDTFVNWHTLTLLTTSRSHSWRLRLSSQK